MCAVPMANDPLFAWETLDAALADGLADLVALHWEEAATDKDAFPMAPDWPGYRATERAGALKILTFRRGAALLGYNIFFVQPTLHHRNSLWAINDLIYLDPDHRRGLAGARLIREAEARLRLLGVKKIAYASKPHVHLGHGKVGATLGDLLVKLGYKHAESIFDKVL